MNQSVKIHIKLINMLVFDDLDFYWTHTHTNKIIVRKEKIRSGTMIRAKRLVLKHIFFRTTKSLNFALLEISISYRLSSNLVRLQTFLFVIYQTRLLVNESNMIIPVRAGSPNVRFWGSKM